MTTGKDGTDRIVILARTYTGKFRDGSGIVREVATGCRDESAARRVLADLERRAELVKAKILTTAEDAVADHQHTSLDQHFAAYLTHLEAEGTSPAHRENVNRCLRRLAADCRFSKLADLTREALERWLVAKADEGMGARTRNTYRAALVAFGNWCADAGRLLGNPFAALPKADERAGVRRQRRALDEKELARLLDVAHRRPLVDRMTIRRGKRNGEAVAELREETRRRLETLGRERALIYKTLVLTGLRKGSWLRSPWGNWCLTPPRLSWCLTRPTKRTGRARRFPFGPTLPPILGMACREGAGPPGSYWRGADGSV